jgi:hypothetical protein
MLAVLIIAPAGRQNIALGVNPGKHNTGNARSSPRRCLPLDIECWMLVIGYSFRLSLAIGC